MNRNLLTIAVGAILLGGCVYPYESAFQTCDNQAGACYQVCEGAPDEDGLTQCHSVCEESANQCFDDAYAAQNYQGSSYAYRQPWYGSYGYWRPGGGYIFSFDYYGGRSRYHDPYYYRGRHGHRGGYYGRRGRHGDGHHRGRRGGRHGDGHDGNRGGGNRGGRDGGQGGGQGGGATPPPASPPRAAPPEARPAPPKRPQREIPRSRDGRRIDKE